MHQDRWILFRYEHNAGTAGTALVGALIPKISQQAFGIRSVQSLDDASAAALLELDNEPGRPVAARLPEELE